MPQNIVNLLQRLYYVGIKCGNPSTRFREAVTRVTHWTSRMKGLVRIVMWWPNFDSQIEEMVSTDKSCSCSSTTKPLTLAIQTLVSYSHGLHGTILNVPRWIEVFPAQSSTTKTIIQHLKALFAQFGLPDIIATDNGPCSVNSKFEDFLTMNGIKHWRSSPYHPSSNGLAEKLSKGLKKMNDESLNDRLARLARLLRI